MYVWLLSHSFWVGGARLYSRWSVFALEGWVQTLLNERRYFGWDKNFSSFHSNIWSMFHKLLKPLITWEREGSVQSKVHGVVFSLQLYFTKRDRVSAHTPVRSLHVRPSSNSRILQLLLTSTGKCVLGCSNWIGKMSHKVKCNIFGEVQSRLWTVSKKEKFASL